MNIFVFDLQLMLSLSTPDTVWNRKSNRSLLIQTGALMFNIPSYHQYDLPPVAFYGNVQSDC